MARKLLSFLLYVCVLVSVSLLFTGCDLSSLENYNGNSNLNNSDRYDGLTVILNGHVGDEHSNDDLVTPCAFYYDKKMIVVQNEFWNSIPNDTLGMYKLPNGYQYLVLSCQFRNGSNSDASVYMTSFNVYADNKLCDRKYIINDDIVDHASVSSGREATIYGFFSVPKNADVIEIEYDSGFFSDTLIFTVQNEGRFTDEDVEEINAALDRLRNGEAAQPTPTIDPDAPVTITCAESDTYFHSDSANKDYTVELTYDGNYSTPWQDGSDGDAIGETLTYHFVCADITRVEIVNGNRKNSTSYSHNNRLAKVTLHFILDGNQVHEEVMEFADDESIVETVLNLDSPVTCNSIIIIIDEVYPGSDYSDTGISEVMFFTN